MPSFAELKLRHARVYAERLQAIETEFRQGGPQADQAIADLRLSVGQIEAGQSWSAGHLDSNEAASEICWNYAAAGNFSTDDGDSVLSLYVPAHARNHWLEAALAAARHQRNRRREAIAQYALGQTRLQINDPKTALELLESSLELFRSEDDRQHCGITLLAIASVHSRAGHAREAIGYIEQALEIFTHLKSTWEGTALELMARAHDSLGDNVAARSAFERSLTLFRDAGDRTRAIGVLVGLGGICSQMGDTELARKHLREALSLLGERTGTVRLGYYTTHFTDIGLRLIRLGDLSGIELIEEDVRYFRQREQPVGEAYTLLALGTAQNSSERPEEAIVVFEKALMLFRKLADRFGEAMVLHHMARTELARNRVSEALLLCERAASLCDVPANPVNRAHVLLTTSRALHRLGRGSEAAEAAAEAAAILESLGHKHASEARSIVGQLQ